MNKNAKALENGNIYVELIESHELKSFGLEIYGDDSGLRLLSAICKIVSALKPKAQNRTLNFPEVKIDLTRFLNSKIERVILNRVDLNAKTKRGCYFLKTGNLKIKKPQQGGRNYFKAQYSVDAPSGRYHLNLKSGVLYVKVPAFKRASNNRKVEIFGDSEGFKYLSKILNKISNLDLSLFYKSYSGENYGDHYHLDGILSKGSAHFIVFRFDTKEAANRKWYGSGDGSFRFEKRRQATISSKDLKRDLLKFER